MPPTTTSHLSRCHFLLRGKIFLLSPYLFPMFLEQIQRTNNPRPSILWTTSDDWSIRGQVTLGINIHLITVRPKERNNFTTAKQIVFFIDSPFRPMLNILSHFIFQQATGDVFTLQPSILKSTPVNKNLTGFFTCVFTWFPFLTIDGHFVRKMPGG